MSDIPVILGGNPVFPDGLQLVRPTVPTEEELAPYLKLILQSRYVSNFGPISQEYEAEICRRLQVKHALALSNLSTGLMYMPIAAGLTEGEVIVPSFTFAATVHSMKLGGLTPVFADVRPQDFTLDPNSVERAISPNTVAVCAVHLYGTPAQVGPLQALCDRYGLKLFFDAAHGLGALVDGKPLGGFGTAEGFSTSATKSISTLGEGGFLTTNSDEIAERVRKLRNWGHNGDYNSQFPSIVSKLPEIAAAAGLIEFGRLEQYIAWRHHLVQRAKTNLASIPGVSFPEVASNCRSGLKDFAIIFDPDVFGLHVAELYEALKAEGVGTRRYYSPAAHQMDAYRKINLTVPLPITEYAVERVLCVPLFNDMTEEQMDRLCELIFRMHRSAPEIKKKLRN